jgi:Fe-S-cluster containining protein
MQCGTCCSIPKDDKGNYIKRIPLYPEEVNKLIVIARERNISLKVKEDLVFPDILNKKILVLTYRFILEPSNYCIFHNPIIGCTIHENKPLSCQAYPLAIRIIDAFNLEISIDPFCNWIEKNYDELKQTNLQNLKEIFPEEYENAVKFLRKNKRLQLKIKRLEAENKIKISRKISLDDFNRYLNEWDRIEIITK